MTQTNEAVRVLPCPFCGGAPKGPTKSNSSDERSGYNFIVRIECQCGVKVEMPSHQNSGGWCDDTGQAEANVLAAWNRRASVAKDGEEEPVAWMRKTDITELTDSEPETNGWTPLYATPKPETSAEQPAGEVVAIVDEGDDGLFVEIVHGKDGTPLKLGDKLYLAAPISEDTGSDPIGDMQAEARQAKLDEFVSAARTVTGSEGSIGDDAEFYVLLTDVCAAYNSGLSVAKRERTFVAFIHRWFDSRAARNAGVAAPDTSASDALRDAAQNHVDSLDAYDNDLVPINRTRGTAKELRAALSKSKGGV